jgi:hypothetical protein
LVVASVKSRKIPTIRSFFAKGRAFPRWYKPPLLLIAIVVNNTAIHDVISNNNQTKKAPRKQGNKKMMSIMDLKNWKDLFFENNEEEKIRCDKFNQKARLWNRKRFARARSVIDKRYLGQKLESLHFQME